jgi:hypothetical protein
MISIQQEGSLSVAAVFAEFTLSDFKRIEEEVLRQLAAQERVQLLIDLRDMLAVTVDVALEDIRFARAHAHERGRVAILSERDTVAWTALLAQWLVDAEIKVFDDEALARAWLAGEDV